MINCQFEDEVYFLRGKARYNKGECGMAILDYNKAIKLNPRNPEYYNCRGISKIRTGEFAEAYADFDKALKVDPMFVYAQFKKNINRFMKHR